jgi:hypothetical protein
MLAKPGARRRERDLGLIPMWRMYFGARFVQFADMVLRNTESWRRSRFIYSRT